MKSLITALLCILPLAATAGELPGIARQSEQVIAGLKSYCGKQNFDACVNKHLFVNPLEHHVIPGTIELCCDQLKKGVAAEDAQRCGREFKGFQGPLEGVQKVQRCLRGLKPRRG